MQLLPCQELFGVVRGDQVRALLETVSGQKCPCIRGLTCPLVPPPAVEDDGRHHLAVV